MNNKKTVFTGALAFAAAIGTAGCARYIYFKNLPMKERCDKCSVKFKKAISSLGKGLPDIGIEECADNSGELKTFGNGEFISEAKSGAKWRLGYAEKSILPGDINEKKYCIAGNTRFPANYQNGVLDDILIRTVVIDDGSGRGAVSFSAVDCIGLSNKNVNEIRSRLSAFSKENNIALINVSSTHTHSGIDTMGIWGPIVEVYKNNKKVLKTGSGSMMSSCDDGYVDFVLNTVAGTVKAAYADMKPGRLFKAYMGKNSQAFMSGNKVGNLSDRGLSGFVWDRRPPRDCSTQLLRLRFVPDDKKKKETLILNFGAHPYINSMKIDGKGNGDLISGDFIYSLCETIKKSGSNAMFINGAVAAVYPSRLYSDRLGLSDQAKAVGNEIARIALSMTKQKKEIYKNEVTNPDNYEKELGLFNGTDRKSNYSAWLELKNDEIITETEIPPILNIRIKEVELKVDNPIFELIGKLKIGKFNMRKKPDGTLSSFTEVGYLEMGNGDVKAALIPGELEPEVLSGSYGARSEFSYSGADFSAKPLSYSASDNSLCVFGLTNDAIGYIIPDNDFSMMFLGSSSRMQKLFGAHYLEIFSFGKYTAASLANAFEEIINETEQRNGRN